MIKEHSYRIKEGVVKNSNSSIPFDFGIVDFRNGIYYADLYINPSYNLEETLDNVNNTFGEYMSLPVDLYAGYHQ